MPGNINNMLKQYKKFATGSCKLKGEIGPTGSITVPLSLNFTPDTVFLEGEIEGVVNPLEFCVNNHNSIKFDWRGQDSGWIKVELKDNMFCNLKVSNWNSYHNFTILKWYAIG